jgi:hypothetical protein
MVEYEPFKIKTTVKSRKQGVTALLDASHPSYVTGYKDGYRDALKDIKRKVEAANDKRKPPKN